jgi:hypothetical protein
MKPYHLALAVVLAASGCGGTNAVTAPENSTLDFVGVTIETSWMKSTCPLAIASDSVHSQFTANYPLLTNGGRDLVTSVSVAYVGSVEFKNTFGYNDMQSGDLIAVRVSIFDQSTKSMIQSETTYTLYDREDVTLYHNSEYGLTVTAATHVSERP